MKPILLGLTLPFLIAFNVYAQESTHAQVPDSVPQGWKEFSPNDGNFKVLMPGVPRQVSEPIDKTVPATSILYGLTTKTVEFSVGYTAFLKDVETIQPSKLTLDGIRDRVLDKEAGKLLAEEDILVENHPGRALAIEVTDGIFRDKYILAGNRLYIASVFIHKPEAASESDRQGIRKSQEEIAKRFLDSFKLIVK